jgi:hypothetical protein
VETCEVTAITCFVDRTGVFDAVDQQMMIVALKKPTVRSKKGAVAIRTIPNGQSWEHLSVLNAEQDQVVWMREANPIWCLSSKIVDYTIMTKVCERQPVLGKMKEFETLNGGFVWNQHKERLRPTEGENILPLLSSASIEVHRCTFPPADRRVSQRLFANALPPITEPIHRNQAILLKRTTPEKVKGRRIVAALLPDDFLVKYPAYFVENHVNLIRLTQSDTTPEAYLSGLSAWFNSRLANFVFSMMNGSSHLSKFELQLMPVPMSLLTELSNFTVAVLANSGDERHKILNQIDEHIFKFFGLSLEESQRVAQLVPLNI